jgi:hypothetical protein
MFSSFSHTPLTLVTDRLLVAVLALVALLVVLSGCEPYLSMTDPVTARARKATTVLPAEPRFVAMVNMHDVVDHAPGLLGNQFAADSIRAAFENGRTQEFMAETGFDPTEDLHEAYFAMTGEDAFSLVVFADVARDRLEQYVEAQTDGRIARSTYRDATVYQAQKAASDEEATGNGDDDADAEAEENGDGPAFAIAEEGVYVAARTVDEVRGMVDRLRDGGRSLSANPKYMELVRRVSRGSSAWVVGSGFFEEMRAQAERARKNSTQMAGFAAALGAWSNRVLGMTETSSTAGRGLNRLKNKVRDIAVAVTLSSEQLEGKAFFTMSDDASASDVVDVAQGAVAALRLSQDQFSESQRALLDDLQVERDGELVQVAFTLSRSVLRDLSGEQMAAHWWPYGPAQRAGGAPVHQAAPERRMPVTYVHAPAPRVAAAAESPGRRVAPVRH